LLLQMTPEIEKKILTCSNYYFSGQIACENMWKNKSLRTIVDL
jgi:hypothetical protein